MDPDPEQDSNEIEETIDYLMFHIVKLCTDSKTMDYDDLREWLDPWVRHPPTKFYDLFVTSKKKDDKNNYVLRLMLKVTPDTAVKAVRKNPPELTHFFLDMRSFTVRKRSRRSYSSMLSPTVWIHLIQ